MGINCRFRLLSGQNNKRTTSGNRFNKNFPDPFPPVTRCHHNDKTAFPVIYFFFAFRHKKDLDAVLLTGSPFHPFLISIFVKKLLSVPTFLDFRDAWSLNNGFDGKRVKYFRERFRRRLFALFERVAIQFASGVIFATNTLQEEYRRLLPFQQEKFHTITNGYDAEDFVSVIPIRMVGKKTIILAGQFNLYTPEVLSGLMQALKSFPLLHFIYVGSENDIIYQKAKFFESESQVTTFPYLPHREMINRIAGADYGLVTASLPNILGTKIFDYLALKKPILCFVPPGSEIIRNFAREKSIVICESPHTLESIKKGLNLLLEVKEVTNKKILNQFSRKETTKRLAKILQMANTT
jgi:glycosyltransferase involved in cell wall biosynthesis